MKHTLEASKIFPYVAWITVLLFSIFTYNLVRELQTAVAELEEATQATVSAMKAN